MKARILNAAERAKAIESKKFAEKDLRGLTDAEKTFVRENGYNVCVSQYFPGRGYQKLYMFVARQANGRKALYAITKRQSIAPNRTDIFSNVWNFEVWMLFDAAAGMFSMTTKEIRRGTNNAAVNGVLIHA